MTDHREPETRTAEDALEEIAATGAWANRGEWWCSSCKLWVGVTYRRSYDEHFKCERCKKEIYEGTEEARYVTIAKAFFGLPDD